MDNTVFQPIKERYNELEQQLQSSEVVSDRVAFEKVSIEYNSLKDTITLIERIESVDAAIEEAKETITANEDPDFTAMAKEELQKLEPQKEQLESELQIHLLPKDPNDNKNIIVEIRAGAGGDESALFAAELFRAYTRFAETKKWSVEILSANRTGIDGYKEVIAEINGVGAFSEFKYESGVHRVQRIPETEKSGRVHTSTVTVAVLPEAEEVELEIAENDLRIDVFRSGGNGGQSVNTTDSAVRITHIPTGMVVSCQDEKSQHKNKAKALTVLRSRLLAQMEEEERKKRGDERQSQVGTGDRSEKIRTYNYPQDRITDHRIKKNWNNLQAKMDGDLEAITTALRTEDQEQQLANLEQNNAS